MNIKEVKTKLINPLPGYEAHFELAPYRKPNKHYLKNLEPKIAREFCGFQVKFPAFRKLTSHAPFTHVKGQI